MRQITLTSSGLTTLGRTTRDCRVWEDGQAGGPPVLHAQDQVPGTMPSLAGELRQMARYLEVLANALDGV